MLKITLTLSDILAIYAALLATYTFVVQRLDRKPKVKSLFTQGLLAGHFGDAETILSFEAVNVGDRNVSIQGHGVILPGGQTVTFTDLHPVSARLPKELSPGQSVKLFRDPVDFAAQLYAKGYRGTLRLVSFFLDAEGRRYKSRVLRFNVEGWISSRD